MNTDHSLRSLTDVSSLADEQLLAACSRGESRAQYRLYELCYSFMMRICIRYTRSHDDAEDLLNKSFLKVLNNVANRKPEVPFNLWLRRITINTVIDEYRKTKKENEQTEIIDFNEQGEDFDSTSVNSYLAKIEVEQLQALINTLPEMSGKVFNLFVVDGFSHKEIAALLSMSEGTSKWHLNNARTRLKQLLTTPLPKLKTIAS